MCYSGECEHEDSMGNCTFHKDEWNHYPCPPEPKVPLSYKVKTWVKNLFRKKENNVKLTEILKIPPNCYELNGQILPISEAPELRNQLQNLMKALEQGNYNIPKSDNPFVPTIESSRIDTDLGEEMSVAEAAALFGEPVPEKPKDQIDLESSDPFKDMTVKEIEAWERKQDNSNDIYKIQARVNNLAICACSGSLTPVGKMMVNSFVHVLKDLYDFADTIEDNTLREQLVAKIRSHESMPADLISAIGKR